VVTGYYVDDMNKNHAFTWQAGVFTPFDLPGAADTYLVTAHDGVFQGSNRLAPIRSFRQPILERALGSKG
jgi:hypothetical protein